MQVSVKKPCTFYIQFKGVPPRSFNLFHEKYGLYFFRNLDGKTPRIKFNLCHPGVYSSPQDFEVVKCVPIEKPATLPALPPYERNEIKDFVIVDNPDLQGSPARVFVKEGIVERGRELFRLPKPVRVFILLHEVGHFFYGITEGDMRRASKMSDPDARDFLTRRRNESEMKCDLFALIHFLEMGYNRSTAFYALSNVLHRSSDNNKRLQALFNNIQKTQTNEL